MRSSMRWWRGTESMLNPADLDELELYMYEERAAILEYDAGMERWRAEEWAMKSIEAKRYREEMERERGKK